MPKIKKISHFIKELFIRTTDLVYPAKNFKAKPFTSYVFLVVLNRTPLKMVKFLEPFLKSLNLKCQFTILGKNIWFNISKNLYDARYHGTYPHELRISENMMRLVPKKSVFFDIGSATGWYSILLADKCEKIIAFDPEDSSSVENTQLNKVANFTFYPYFISDHSNKSQNEFSVDDLIKEGIPKPNVVKIDVEKGEAKVLYGMKNLLSSSLPDVMLIETHSEDLFYECLNFLKQFQYNIYNLGCPKINVGGDIYPLSYDLNNDILQTASKTRTILCLKKY